MKSSWPYLAYYHVRAYESRVMELIRGTINSPKLCEAIKTAYQNVKKEKDEEQKKILDQLIEPFEDKELAKPLMKEYCGLLVQGLVKNPSDFEKQLSENEQLRKKTEKDFGQPITDERLQAVMTDSGWNANRLIKSNIVEQIEKT